MEACCGKSYTAMSRRSVTVSKLLDNYLYISGSIPTETSLFLLFLCLPKASEQKSKNRTFSYLTMRTIGFEYYIIVRPVFFQRDNNAENFIADCMNT